MSGIEIVNGTVETHRYEMEHLLVEHVEELTTNKELMKLNPDWDSYIQLEKEGGLFSLFVKHEGKLIGYSVNFISHHLHYSDLVVANNDVLFLTKEYRANNIGRDLISMTEERARQLGAHLYLLHAKQKTALDGLLPHLGYRIQDIIHSKVL
jgi:GNAT superfamily N-acetyltransferase